ncbi:MAG: hypothetical protein KC416_08745, partial [Myxococcales bacterium]|nr:hypothetical protein [Myxococcales bacterium]
MHAPPPPPTDRRTRTAGSAGPDTLMLIAAVALGGATGFGLLGSAMGSAITGNANGSVSDNSVSDDGTVALTSAAAEGHVPADGPTTAGIDVSYWQGTIDWNQVASSGVEYAYMRVSDGTTFMDPKFQENWANSQAAGVRRGAYQFYRPNQDPIEQAKLFVEQMGPLGPNDLPPMLDLEVGSQAGVSPQQLVEGALAWARYVEEATGRRPVIYAGYYFWNADAGGSDAFADYPFWVPNYSSEWPLVPDPWQTWTFFQHSATGRVPGIAGDVD